MKLYFKKHFQNFKKLILAGFFIAVSASSAFSQNAFDSDMSNSAGSNAGNEHTGFFICIVLFIILPIFVAYFGGKKKNSDSAYLSGK
jgi:hypothetical protein